MFLLSYPLIPAIVLCYLWDVCCATGKYLYCFLVTLSSPWNAADFLTFLRRLTKPHTAYIRLSTFTVFQTKVTVYFILSS